MQVYGKIEGIALEVWIQCFIIIMFVEGFYVIKDTVPYRSSASFASILK